MKKHRPIVDALNYHIHHSNGMIEKKALVEDVDVVIKHVKKNLKVKSLDDIESGPPLLEVEEKQSGVQAAKIRANYKYYLNLLSKQHQRKKN